MKHDTNKWTDIQFYSRDSKAMIEPQLFILFKMLSGIQHIVNNFVLKHGKFNFFKGKQNILCR